MPKLTLEQKKELLQTFLRCHHCNLELENFRKREEHASKGSQCRISCHLGCDDKYKTLHMFLTHLSQQHGIKNLKNILRRLEKEASKEDVPVTCRLCFAILPSSCKLLEHFQEQHQGEHPFKCEVCGQKAGDEAKLKRHMQCHEPGRPKEYCNICFKEFRNKVSLRTHRNMVHKMGKQYTCSYCGKILYSSQYVKKHEATHMGQKFKAVQCKHCGKTVEYTKVSSKRFSNLLYIYILSVEKS